MSNRKKAGMMRKAIALNMHHSWITAPKCDYYMEMDAQPLVDFRKKINSELDAKISYLSFVMKAAAQALSEYPHVNATYYSDDNTYEVHDNINVGFAMQVGDGLMVLCTHDTDKTNLIGINESTQKLIEKARERKVVVEDITGSTFTVNNMGAHKRLICHSAIINQPESAILSFYGIADRPVVRNGQLVVGKTMNIALSADHRLIDGGLACAFLSRICDLLEEPELLLGIGEERK